MNTHPAAKNAQSPADLISTKILMDKMGLTRREVHEIETKYGVPASRLIELMQLSKYRFVHQEERVRGRCAPCSTRGKLNVVPF